MPSRQYPLQPVLDHRDAAVDNRTAELGGAVRTRENADEAKVRAEAVQIAAEEAAAAVRASEAALLARGTLRAGDLARGQAWEIGAQAQIAELTRAVDVADRRLEEARASEVSARSDLAQAMADRDVVAKDATKFQERAQKKALAAEEEQAEEAYRGNGH